jgi:predicted phage tail protein
MSKINTKDFTSKGSIKQIGKRNSGGTEIVSSPKDQLKALQVQKKDLKAQLKTVEKQETQIKKQISKSKTTNNKKKVVSK